MSTAATPPEAATNAELVRWAFNVLNTQDVAPLKPYWTESTRERFPNATCVGPVEISAYFEAAFAAVPDFHIYIVALAADGDDVFVEWRITGTHSGAEWQGIAPTGKSLEPSYFAEYRLAELPPITVFSSDLITEIPRPG